MTRSPRLVPLICALATALALCGCASSLSGFAGAPRYACQAPVGAQCVSVSGVYANAVQVPVEISSTARSSDAPPGAAAVIAPAAPAETILPAANASTAAAPLRSNVRVLRLWIAPWEDSDGDLHEASVVHVVVDAGRWLIERVRSLQHSRLDLVRPPVAPPGSSNSALEAKPSVGAQAVTNLEHADRVPTEQ